MKRFIVALLTLMLVFMGVSCGQKKTVKSAKSGLDSSFTCDMILMYDDSEFCATVNRVDIKSWDIEFSSPETLAGVKLSFVNDDVTASYKGLDFTVPKKALPVKSILSNFIMVVDEISSQEKLECAEKDGELVVEGKTDTGEYKLAIDEKNGMITSFEMKNADTVIEFENVVIHSSPVHELPQTTTGVSETEISQSDTVLE